MLDWFRNTARVYYVFRCVCYFLHPCWWSNLWTLSQIPLLQQPGEKNKMEICVIVLKLLLTSVRHRYIIQSETESRLTLRTWFYLLWVSKNIEWSVHVSHMPLHWHDISNRRWDNTRFDIKFKWYLVWHKVCFNNATYQNILSNSKSHSHGISYQTVGTFKLGLLSCQITVLFHTSRGSWANKGTN